jgi:addiction module HigA family antidote
MRTKSASKTITRNPNWLGPAIPPGEILLEEYLKPLGVGQLEAAKRLGISLNRLNEIVLGKRGITADTALRLARWLETSPQLWMRLQADWDLHEACNGRRSGRRNDTDGDWMGSNPLAPTTFRKIARYKRGQERKSKSDAPVYVCSKL